MPPKIQLVKFIVIGQQNMDINMITITLEGKEYQLDIEQAKELGLLKEKDGRVKSWEEFKCKYPNHFLSYISSINYIRRKSFSSFLKTPQTKKRLDWRMGA